MPKIAKSLTTVALNRINKPGWYAVGGVAGLLLQVRNPTREGAPIARSWILRVRVGDPGEDGAIVDARGDLAAGREAAALRQRDQLLDEGLNSLRLGDRGLDLAVLEETSREVAEHRATVIFLHAQLLAKYTVTHDSFLSGLDALGRARVFNF